MNVSPRNSIRSFPGRTYSSDEVRERVGRPLRAERALEVGELDERHGRVGRADRRPVLGDALEERARLVGARELDAGGRAAAVVVAGREERARHDRGDHDHDDDRPEHQEPVARGHARQDAGAAPGPASGIARTPGGECPYPA